MSEQQDKKESVVEWSFSFEKLGDSLNQQFRKMGIGDEEVKKEHFETGLGDAASARVELNLSIGRTEVKALENVTNLFEADVAYTGEMRFEVYGDSDKRVKLGQQPAIGNEVREAIGKWVNRQDLYWDVGLSPKIPLSLEVNSGVGEGRLDLSSLQLTSLKIRGGVGDTRLNLPATGSSYPVKVSGAVGNLRIALAEGASAKLDIEGGVGGVTIKVPAQAAIHIRVDGGLGGVDLPKTFKQVKTGSDFISKSGVWETEGYALAAQQIQIDYKGGVGGFKLTTLG